MSRALRVICSVLVLLMLVACGIVLVLYLLPSNDEQSDIEETFTEANEYTFRENRIFRDWKKRFRKKYPSQNVELQAMHNFFANKKEIDEHNKLFEQGKVTFKRSTWFYSDLSVEDKSNGLTGLATPPGAAASRPPVGPVFPSGPISIDWSEKGLVGPVWNQGGGCNSCWAFSAAGVVEAVMRRKGVNASLSSQQLVDCSKKNCFGCHGGWPKFALDYVKTNGIADDEDYPYYESENPCVYTEDQKVGYINATFIVATRGNETLLRDIVASVGPVSAVICLENSFYNYHSGVYNEPKCCKDIKHAVLITGYGTDTNYGDYWIVKNSWGTSWGEQGFVRIARNRENMCNIAYYAVYAT